MFLNLRNVIIIISLNIIGWIISLFIFILWPSSNLVFGMADLSQIWLGVL